MAKLTAAARKKMPSKEFALPGKKAFPMNDASHQRMAISGATRSEHAGNISAGTANKIKAKARSKLSISKGAKSGSKSSGGFDHHDSMLGHIDPNKKC